MDRDWPKDVDGAAQHLRDLRHRVLNKTLPVTGRVGTTLAGVLRAHAAGDRSSAATAAPAPSEGDGDDDSEVAVQRRIGSLRTQLQHLQTRLPGL